MKVFYEIKMANMIRRQCNAEEYDIFMKIDITAIAMVTSNHDISL